MITDFNELIKKYQSKDKNELDFLEKLLSLNNFDLTKASNDYNTIIKTLKKYLGSDNNNSFIPAIKEFLKDKPYIFMSLVDDDMELFWDNYEGFKDLGLNLKYIANQPDFYRDYIKIDFYLKGEKNFEDVIKALNENKLETHLNEKLNTKLIIETINLSSKIANELINAFNEYKLPYTIKEDLSVYTMAMNSCINNYCDTIEDIIDEVNSCIELAQENLKPLMNTYNFFDLFNIGQYFKKETDQNRCNKLLKKLLTKNKVNPKIISKLAL